MEKELLLGIDVGSTTVKVAVVDPESKDLLYSKYERHYAEQLSTVARLLQEVDSLYPDTKFRVAVCGSGGKPVANCLDIKFVQEVVANAAAVCALYPMVRTAIELGGQDAKIIFFYDDPEKGLQTSDMRMNGSCAGGTGAFIDEIAKLLNVDTEQFEALASKGTHVFDISGRCGVFAKTDIQPLLIQGASREDIALSTFHAIAKQTIGGLSQGLELKAPIIFEGGPLTFNPTLIRVFAERLNLKEDEIILPDHPETIVARGTALAVDQLFGQERLSARSLPELIEKISQHKAAGPDMSENGHPFFASEAEYEAFTARHDAEVQQVQQPHIKDGVLRAYLGIDSGSTTSKMVLLDEENRVVDTFYANNNGMALDVVKRGILGFFDKYRQQGVKLEILGMGTTGYGEKMLAKAFGADYHVVETVAHAQACVQFHPEATFLLDIGGQDMKAIWLDHGIITNIMLNEACSSGCGSFLENFAGSLGITVENASKAAFRSKNPAVLGSRCTVFMNSTIINEQRNGKQADDIMAGLCRSIIENVFTKVVRIANVNNLGEHIVVQGGTFRNRAVLRAIEEYIGRDVILAPYSGEMGALGAAILTKRQIEEFGYQNGKTSNFIGEDAVRAFEYATMAGVQCPHCANHCSRTVITFSTGETWVTGNRCERGAVITKKDEEVKSQSAKTKPADDLFAAREVMLFKEYDCEPVRPEQGETVGLPRVLEFWDSMPFWSTFFRALGYKVKYSSPSNKKMYERGIEFVTSDTICFPAKLVHGHVLDLAEKKVDRIFLPYVMHMPYEGKNKSSQYVCAVVQGYPMVVRNSQNPEERYGVKFDTPVFHWFNQAGRRKQVCKYAMTELGVSKAEAEQAFVQGECAILSFRHDLQQRAKEIISDATANNNFVVVLAGRPYHTDSFVSHRVSKMFTERGIPVVPVDSLPELSQADLKNTRIEVTNNFHTRMLSGALVAAKDANLEYVQIVSFGCGHDAVLSDEITRILSTVGEKPPLILKMDESDAKGSLGIRVESFIETIKIRRRMQQSFDNLNQQARSIPSPSPTKFYKAEKKKRTILIPNLSPEITILLQAVLENGGFKAKPLPLGGIEQVKLGKKYVHNDICFPCQMVVGEALSELLTGKYQQDEVAVAMVKFACDCRMSHYAGLLRIGLDSAGFKDVPIVTTDLGDSKEMHPGIKILGISTILDAVWVFLMMDTLDDLKRHIRPYEITKGETEKVYRNCINKLAIAIRHSIKHARKMFEVCVQDMMDIPYDISKKKPKVFVTGEILVTYHAGTNFHIEDYLINNGMEVIFPRATDQLRKDFQAAMREIKEYDKNSFPWTYPVTWFIDMVQGKLEKVASRHPLYERALSPKQMYQGVKEIIPETLSCGEGWLMASEINHYAQQGVKSFVILQPFGCLPNHICGRGVIKRLKERYPDIHILPLDLDPDTSFANVENRLQMLLMDKT